MFKFLLGFAFGAILVYNVDIASLWDKVEFQQKQVEISVPTLK